MTVETELCMVRMLPILATALLTQHICVRTDKMRRVLLGALLQMLGKVLLAILITYIVGSFLSWLLHWGFHRPWSGPLYRAHLAHHAIYSRGRFLSGAYIGAGKNAGTIFFTLMSFPITAPVFGTLWIIGAPLWMHIMFAAGGTTIGLVTNWIHEAIHVKGHWMERFFCFRRLRALHHIHHMRVRSNLSMFDFTWDKVFRTYRSHGSTHQDVSSSR